MTGSAILGVVFDFDGTVTKPFFDFGVIKDEIGMPHNKLILEYIEDKDEAFKRRAIEILDKWELAAAERAELNENILPLFNYLRWNGIKMAILTRNKKASVDVVLGKFRLKFDYIDTRDNEPVKPHPEAMTRVIKMLCIPPSSILTIGDFEHDILCGKEAGTKTMYLTNGKKNYSLKQEPDYIVTNLLEGLEIIKTLI